ncbi:hypothetical protein HPB49_026464 [Dermacentor silvarum]|nr:hypothetical protein HPB49_026464 [Dermacentor silvarum]
MCASLGLRQTAPPPPPATTTGTEPASHSSSRAGIPPDGGQEPAEDGETLPRRQPVSRLAVGLAAVVATANDGSAISCRYLSPRPVHHRWCWAARNRTGNDRKGGGVGLLWRCDLHRRMVDGDCADHLWAIGDVLGRPTAICVLYLSVDNKQRIANGQLAECIRADARTLAAGKQCIIVGDFNGHLNELDGFTDSNGQLLLQMAEDLQLEIANLGSSCDGQVTWCACGSCTSIDYALVSPRLGALLRRMDIDEKGLYSLCSDHNRLLLEFSYSGSRGARARRPQTQSTYLPSKAVQAVMEEFETCPWRNEATTYEEYVCPALSDGTTCRPRQTVYARCTKSVVGLGSEESMAGTPRG